MKMNLTNKIILPIALIGLLILIVLGVLHGIEQRQETLANREIVLNQLQTQVREVSARVQSGILTRQESYAIDAANAALAADQAMTALAANYPKSTALLAKFQDYYAGMVAINSVYLENRQAEGEKRLGELRARELAVDQAVNAAVTEAHGELANLHRLGLTFKLASVLGLIAVTVLIAMFVIRNVVRPIKEMAVLLHAIAEGEGDLTARVVVRGECEIGEIATAFNTMMDKLRNLVSGIAANAGNLKANSEQVIHSMQTMTENAAKQSDAASATASALEQVSVSVGQVAEHAKEADAVSIETDRLAQEGDAAARHAAEGMHEIARAIGDAAGLVDGLAARSDQIRGIVAVIHDIADQTNLLALNAAIEAARAGEQGRGFAVVADEVRKLAERTTQATAEIAQVIDGIAKDTHSAVQAMNQQTTRQEAGVALANDLSQRLGHIREQAAQAARRTSDIVAATREQDMATQDIARHVEDIAQRLERSNAEVAQLSALAHSLARLAEEQQTQVGRFRV
jgi:methyl-accepting chemotaxis protein